MDATFDTRWYDLWKQQSQDFFETANNNLKDLFKDNTFVDPQMHRQQIDEWMTQLQHQWERMHLNAQQKTYENYWQWVLKLSTEATELMVQEWTKRVQEQEPINNIQELYELWLNCCHETYTKAMHSGAYQQTYGALMNDALRFWQSVAYKHG